VVLRKRPFRGISWATFVLNIALALSVLEHVAPPQP